METCLYHKRVLCAYELKDEDGIYHQDKVWQLKRAAANGELLCTECNQRVYLAAGLIKEPYFSHYDLTNCSYQSITESEESKTAKRLLYQLAKRSYPELEVAVRYRQKAGFYTTIAILKDEIPVIAIDYQLVMLPIKELEERIEFYREQKIKPVFVLSSRIRSSEDQLNWYQSFLQQQSGYCMILNAFEETLSVKRSFLGCVQRFKQARVFERKYPVRELNLNQDGALNADFLEDCQEKEAGILQTLEQMALQEAMEQQRKSEFLTKQILRIANEVEFTEDMLRPGIRMDVLNQCIAMIKNGDLELVSDKYLKYILTFYSELKKK